jgi:hypothetical protein
MAKRWLLVPVAVSAALMALALPSFADTDTQAPTTPGVPVATFPASGTITLTWTASTDNVGVTGYTVTRWYTDFGEQFTTATNSITLTGERPSDTYRFSVNAHDAAGNVSPSTSLKVTMPPGDTVPPTTPGTPVASLVADTALTLTWTASTDNVRMEEHDIVRIQGSTQTVVTRPNYLFWPNSFRLTGLTPSTTYVFAIRGRDAAGNESGLSGTVTVTTTNGVDASPPTVPTGLGAFNVAADSLTLNWGLSSDNVGVVGYDLQQTLGGTVTTRSTAANTLALSGLAAGTYSFAVRARDAAGNASAYSPAIRVTLPPPPPPTTCLATYQIMTMWPGAFQAQVTIRNIGTTTVNGWTVTWTFPNGQVITNIWNGVGSQTGANVTVRNAAWNGTIPPNGSTWFGFQATWSGTNGVPQVTSCTSP